MTPSDVNSYFFRTLIKELVSSGVRHFCISPGFRSAPLALAAAEHPLVTTSVHIDERGLGYYALGLSKALNEPVAIIVTSGSAVANLLPALIEAKDEGIPLVLLTADRPPELRQTMANQTWDQVKCFSPWVCFEMDLPCPSEELPKNFLKTTVGYAIHMAMRESRGPIHLNCMIRPPLNLDSASFEKKSFPCHYVFAKKRISPNELKTFFPQDFSQKRGVVIAGRMDDTSEILPLLKMLQWPLFADPLSNLRKPEIEPFLIVGYQEFLQIEPPEVILQLGDRCVCHELLNWAAQAKEHIVVAPHPYRVDPNHSVSLRIESEIDSFVKSFLSIVEPANSSSWLSSWRRPQKGVLSLMDQLTIESEPGFIRRLSHLIPETTSLFVSNSMVIRHVDLVYYGNGGPIYGNRGVSGIDGNIATAIGIAAGSKRPLIALLGDTTTLHDLNSLLILQKEPLPILFIVFNNGGGQIFRHCQVKTPFLEELFIAPYQVDFELLAKSLSLEYELFSQKTSLESLLLSLDRPKILEVRTDAKRDMEERMKLREELSEHLDHLTTPIYQ